MVKLEDALQQFWGVEEILIPGKQSKGQELCVAHFEAAHKRMKDGRFQIRLPLKSSVDKLADTFQQARVALLRSEM